MLWVLFNENGQKIYSTNVGNLPYAGTNEFSIFAVFQNLGLSPTGDYTGGSIKLYKPDLAGSSYLPLRMQIREDIEFIGESVTNAFTHGNLYTGLFFDFSTLSTSLIDTAGIWRAVITLFSYINSDVRNVVGSITFNVGNGNENIDGASDDLDTLLTQIYVEFGMKLNKNSSEYLKVIENHTEWEFTGYYNVGDIIFSKDNNGFYRISAEHELIRLNIGGGAGTAENLMNVVLDITSADLSEYPVGSIIFDRETKMYYTKTAVAPGYAEYNIGMSTEETLNILEGE